MKLRRLFLGIAVVTMMAACGGKATETATETAVEATPATEEVATPATPAEEVATPAAPAQETKKADPCEAKVKAFEQFVDEFKAAQKNKANGAKELKAFADMLKQAPEQEAAVKECVENSEFKTRIQNAIMMCKQIRSQK